MNCSPRHVCKRVALCALAALIVAIACSAAPAVARAASIHVSVIGSDTVGTGSFVQPYATVQRAVDAASLGDTVLVGAGDFFGDVVMRDGISLQGAGADRTTLQGTHSGPVVTASGVGTSTTISGFTLTGGGYYVSDVNQSIPGGGGGGVYCSSSSLSITDDIIAGNRTDQWGGGIYCDGTSFPSITNDIISGNAGHGGGGIYCDGMSSPTISNDTINGNEAWLGPGGGILCAGLTSASIINDNISSNTALIGGGVYCSSSSTTIASCTISGNSATIAGRGGGIDCDGFCSPLIVNDVITGNRADSVGGGICCDNCSPRIVNDTIVSNVAPGGGGVGAAFVSSPSIVNCIIWDNGDDLTGCSATCSDIENVAVASGFGNISAAPGFLSAATGDFHLTGVSPCIDAATATSAPSCDRVGMARPQGAGWDIGAYERHTPCVLDYAAGHGGTLRGHAWQIVEFGASGTTVTAVPNAGYHFVNWSDACQSASRTDANVIADATCTACFALNIATKVTITSNKTTVRRRHPVTFSGRISSSQPKGSRIVVRARRPGSRTWVVLSTRLTTSTHQWSFTFSPSLKGKWYFQARFAGATVYAASTSASKKISVK